MIRDGGAGPHFLTSAPSQTFLKKIGTSRRLAPGTREESPQPPHIKSHHLLFFIGVTVVTRPDGKSLTTCMQLGYPTGFFGQKSWTTPPNRLSTNCRSTVGKKLHRNRHITHSLLSMKLRKSKRAVVFPSHCPPCVSFFGFTQSPTCSKIVAP